MPVLFAHIPIYTLRVHEDGVSSVSICLGDDLTDEYLFRSNKGGINIKVGENNNFESQAEYFLKKVDEVHWFLNKLYFYLLN